MAEQLIVQNYVAGGTVAPHRFVNFNPAGEIVAGAAGERSVGISDRVGSPPSVPAATSALAGERLDVVHLGITDIELGETVVPGDLLCPGTGGVGMIADPASEPAGAMALEGGADDEIIRCLVFPAVVTGALGS